MKKLKHQPGPWIVKYVDGLPYPVVVMSEKADGGGGNKYAMCGGGNIQNNLRLISCAPDMLEAVIKRYKHLNKKGGDGMTLAEEMECTELSGIIEHATGMDIEEVIK